MNGLRRTTRVNSSVRISIVNTARVLASEKSRAGTKAMFRRVAEKNGATHLRRVPMVKSVPSLGNRRKGRVEGRSKKGRRWGIGKGR